jgi:hypothetical protein
MKMKIGPEHAWQVEQLIHDYMPFVVKGTD